MVNARVSIHRDVCILALLLFVIAHLPDLSDAAAADTSLRQAILTAEHNRARTEADLALLTEAIGNNDPEIQRLAARALGRLERPELAERIRPLLAAGAPALRRDAATAFGRAFLADRLQAAGAGATLRGRLAVERDAEVRAALCEVIGRLPYQTAEDVQKAEAALIAATQADGAAGSPPTTILGAARGIEMLVRQRIKLSPPAPGTLERLRRLATSTSGAPVRRLALAALVASGKLDPAFLSRTFRDLDSQVRRLTVRGAESLPTGDAGAEAIVARSLKDASPMVRFEALGVYSRRHQKEGCGALLVAVKDRTVHVVLRAIDLLASGCAPDEAVTKTLAHIADGLPAAAAAGGWHAPAHALVSLAKIAAETARPRLMRFAAHPQWQVRAYAARAAATLGEVALLEKLARDSQDNVRTAALSGLIITRRHQADPIYLEALAARDYQLISTAARGLAGTPERQSAVAALLTALARLTAERRDTSRDPRVAILQRLRELGSAEHAAALELYLQDFDPSVAAQAAEMLTAWTGNPQVPLTTILDPGPAPSLSDIDALSSATATVIMRNGGSFELRLLTSEAPAAVLRFVRLAQSGYYDGLTFHRVEPNFVIQGGSPGANEYMGDARYMRDELGRLMHARGTVGISTRGRDTGDAQIFVNLVDNPRLDSDYTVFAEIIRGMDRVDEVLEGDRMDRIEIRTARAARPVVK